MSAIRIMKGWLLVSQYFWIVLLLGAGISHFVLHDFLLAQMPSYMPYPTELVYISGVVEILLALGLMLPRYRKISWLLTAAMCASYLGVHWHVAWNCEELEAINGALHLPCWLAWVRLPIQLLFIVWTLRMAMLVRPYHRT